MQVLYSFKVYFYLTVSVHLNMCMSLKLPQMLFRNKWICIKQQLLSKLTNKYKSM